MLGDWTTYRPEDFLLFGPETYWGLFALQNAAAWPLQPVLLLFGLLVLGVACRPGAWRGRAVAAGLALLWLFVAFGFLRDRYLPINWALEPAIPAFAAEALLLLVCGALANRLQGDTGWNVRRVAGVGLIAYAVLLHPATAPLAGRDWAEAEIFGLAPDPTAMATMGVMVVARGRWLPLLCLLVPLAWCLVSAATLLTLGGWAGWVPLAAAAIAVAARCAGGWQFPVAGRAALDRTTLDREGGAGR